MGWPLRGRGDLLHGYRQGGAAHQPLRLIHQRGGAACTGEGDHQQGCTGRQRGHQLEGALQHLAIADRPSGTAVLTPAGGAGDLGPAQLIGCHGNGLIGAAGGAMQQGHHQAGGGGPQQMGGDHSWRPGEITATGGHDHQLAAAGLIRSGEWR